MYHELCGRRDFPPASGTENDITRPDYLCPSDFSGPVNSFYAGYAKFNYPAVHGGGVASVGDEIGEGNGIFGEAGSVHIDSIKDGAANTYMIGERALTQTGNAGAIWMRSTNRSGNRGDGSAVAGVCDRTVTINDLTKADAFSSAHGRGANFLTADAAVRFEAETIDPRVYERLGRIDDSEPD